MFAKRIATTAVVLAFTAVAALAQVPVVKPATPTVTAPGVTAPAITAPVVTAPAVSAPAVTTPVKPATTKVNLNTATAAQIDGLPQVGTARTKVIMTERAKSPFKDWADFDKRMTGTTVNAGVKLKIKDLVTF